jgi:RNA polymerase sigma-70 factor (ECF subfamily)
MARSFFFWPSLVSSTDEQAMWRVKMDDDAVAFAQLVERWQPPISHLCARMTGDVHRGEDLAQETFIRLFVRRRSYEPTGTFSTFLWRIALNLCYDDLRKTNRRRELSLEVAETGNSPSWEHRPADHAAPDTSMIEGEQAEAVRRAILELTEPYRVVVVLRHYEGLKFREIADVLGIAEGTVKSRMAEALSRLNKLLNPLFAERCPSMPSSNERLQI